MKLRLLGGALFLTAAALFLVPGVDARKTATLTLEECHAACQVGFTKCNVSGRDDNGNGCNSTCCQKQLSDCQTILCAGKPSAQ